MAYGDLDVTEEASEYSDEMLLAGFSRSHSELALRFVRRFQAHVYGVAYAAVPDIAVAEDLARQAFEHALLRANTYDPQHGSVRGWLLRITHNLAVDAVRVQPHVALDPEHLEAVVDQVMHTPEKDVGNAESSASVRGALAALPMDQARAVILAMGCGLTPEQIADHENSPLSAVRYRLRAGMLTIHQA